MLAIQTMLMRRASQTSAQINPLGDDTYGAEFSPCNQYRYTFWREWDNTKGTCVFIGLNPSATDEVNDDQTIKRCINFAKDWGYGRYVMLNLFAYRATDPDDMKKQRYPVGPENDKYLFNACKDADLVVAAWGNHGAHRARCNKAKELLAGIPMKCFKLTVENQPIHLLFQPSTATLKDFG